MDKPKVCVFCGKRFAEGERCNIMTQVVFDGWREHGDGKVMGKRPGNVIYWCSVCEVPDEG